MTCKKYLPVIKRACAAELTEKETTTLHGGSAKEAKKVVATFPKCFCCGKVNHSIQPPALWCSV